RGRGGAQARQRSFGGTRGRVSGPTAVQDGSGRQLPGNGQHHGPVRAAPGGRASVPELPGHHGAPGGGVPQTIHVSKPGGSRPDSFGHGVLRNPALPGSRGNRARSAARRRTPGGRFSAGARTPRSTRPVPAHPGPGVVRVRPGGGGGAPSTPGYG